MKKLILLFFIIVSIIPFSLFSQSDSTKINNQLYVIIKNDGVEFVGQILSRDDHEILIETKKLGRVYVP